jgi:hypothetical protein
MTIERLIESPESKEALQWLQGGAPGSRTLGELNTTEASLSLTKELYSLGAVQVIVVEVDTYDSGEENTGKLVISLPEDQIVRARLFAWNAEHAREMGFDPDKDVGQKHLLLMLD